MNDIWKSARLLDAEARLDVALATLDATVAKIQQADKPAETRRDGPDDGAENTVLLGDAW